MLAEGKYGDLQSLTGVSTAPTKARTLPFISMHPRGKYQTLGPLRSPVSPLRLLGITLGRELFAVALTLMSKFRHLNRRGQIERSQPARTQQRSVDGLVRTNLHH